MAGEKRQSFFGNFGNKNDIHRSSPRPVPDTRNFVNYDLERQKKLPSPNVFNNAGKDNKYDNVEPTVIVLDLTVLRANVEFPVAGNIVWFQSSTNATDVLQVKYERGTATAIPFLPGNLLQGVPFTRLILSNASIPGATAFLVLMKDSPDSPIRVL